MCYIFDDGGRKVMSYRIANVLSREVYLYGDRWVKDKRKIDSEAIIILGYMDRFLVTSDFGIWLDYGYITNPLIPMPYPTLFALRKYQLYEYCSDHPVLE